MPKKPSKYGIHFYIVVGSKYQYNFTLYDNDRGNTSKIPISLSYSRSFPTLLRTIDSQFDHKKSSSVPIDSATALWCALVLNTTKTVPMCSLTSINKAHRYLYVDNFYTRHVFGDKLLTLSNSEIF